jgi:hypothetical protein
VPFRDFVLNLAKLFNFQIRGFHNITIIWQASVSFSEAPTTSLRLRTFLMHHRDSSCLEAEDAVCGGYVCRPAYLRFVNAAEVHDRK